MVRRAVSLGAVATLIACARPTTIQPGLEPGNLDTTWYAGGADCTGVPQFRVRAYNADFFILRQSACTNFEKPFLYLVFGNDRALLFDTGAGGVEVRNPVDTLIRAWLARRGRPSLEL